MRFLMLNWRDPKNPRSGGAERVTLAFLQDLVKRGHEVYWFANAFPDCQPEETLEGIHYVRGGGMGTSVIEARKWYKKQPRFDLVIDQHHGIPWYARWWCGTRTISYIHEVLGPIWDSFYKWPFSFIGKSQEGWTHWLYRNELFLTPSTCTRDFLQKSGVKEVKIIPNGLYTQALATLPEKNLAAPLRLVSVSRLAPNKRIDHAVRLVQSLNAKGVEVRLRIVGGGDSEPDLKKLIQELGLGEWVTLTGPLSESAKDEELRNAHFLVHTSLREGWGLNVIEANAMGTPGAVYPVPGLIESTIDGETGIISKLETPDSLAEALLTLLSKPELYNQFRVKAWERAKSLHWDNILPLASDWFELQASRSGK